MEKQLFIIDLPILVEAVKSLKHSLTSNCSGSLPQQSNKWARCICNAIIKSLQLGALVNEQFQAREGLDADTFNGRLTYLGHYHKPQTVPGTNIRYIGSPYQGKNSLNNLGFI